MAHVDERRGKTRAARRPDDPHSSRAVTRGTRVSRSRLTPPRPRGRSPRPSPSPGVLPAAHWRVGRHAEAVLVLEDGKSVRLPSSKTATMPGSPTRPAILPTVVALIGLALSVVLAGCGTAPTPGANPGGAAANTRPQPERTSGAAAADLVMIIRHGEKPDGSHPGVDANGHPDDSSLTATGWNRAQHLVNLFDPARGAPRAGSGPAERDLRRRREQQRGRYADPRDRGHRSRTPSASRSTPASAKATSRRSSNTSSHNRAPR